MSHRSVLDDDDRSAYASSLHRPMMPAGRQGPPSPAASTSSGSLTFVNLGSASALFSQPAPSFPVMGGPPGSGGVATPPHSGGGPPLSGGGGMVVGMPMGMGGMQPLMPNIAHGQPQQMPAYPYPQGGFGSQIHHTPQQPLMGQPSSGPTPMSWGFPSQMSNLPPPIQPLNPMGQHGGLHPQAPFSLGAPGSQGHPHNPSNMLPNPLQPTPLHGNARPSGPGSGPVAQPPGGWGQPQHAPYGQQSPLYGHPSPPGSMGSTSMPVHSLSSAPSSALSPSHTSPAASPFSSSNPYGASADTARLEEAQRQERERQRQEQLKEERLREQQRQVKLLQEEQQRHLREEQERERIEMEKRKAERERIRQEEERKRQEALREQERQQEAIRLEQMRIFEELQQAQRRMQQEHELQLQKQQLEKQQQILQEQQRLAEKLHLERLRLEEERRREEEAARLEQERVKQEEERRRQELLQQEMQRQEQFAREQRMREEALNEKRRQEQLLLAQQEQLRQEQARAEQEQREAARLQEVARLADEVRRQQERLRQAQEEIQREKERMALELMKEQQRIQEERQRLQLEQERLKQERLERERLEEDHRRQMEERARQQQEQLLRQQEAIRMQQQAQMEFLRQQEHLLRLQPNPPLGADSPHNGHREVQSIQPSRPLPTPATQKDPLWTPFDTATENAEERAQRPRASTTGTLRPLPPVNAATRTQTSLTPVRSESARQQRKPKRVGVPSPIKAPMSSEAHEPVNKPVSNAVSYEAYAAEVARKHRVMDRSEIMTADAMFDSSAFEEKLDQFDGNGEEEHLRSSYYDDSDDEYNSNMPSKPTRGSFLGRSKTVQSQPNRPLASHKTGPAATKSGTAPPNRTIKPISALRTGPAGAPSAWDMEATVKAKDSRSMSDAKLDGESPIEGVSALKNKIEAALHHGRPLPTPSGTATHNRRKSTGSPESDEEAEVENGESNGDVDKGKEKGLSIKTLVKHSTGVLKRTPRGGSEDGRAKETGTPIAPLKKGDSSILASSIDSTRPPALIQELRDVNTHKDEGPRSAPVPRALRPLPTPQHTSPPPSTTPRSHGKSLPPLPEHAAVKEGNKSLPAPPITSPNAPARRLPPKKDALPPVPRKVPTREEAARIIQTRWRGARERRAYSQLTLRTKVAKEIYSSELVYVQSLGVTIDVFLKPLRKAAEQSKPIILPTDIESIFGNLEDIYAYHLQLVSKLEARISKWNINMKIGDTFLDMKQDFITLYSLYINRYDQALETLARCRELKSFKTFIMRCNQHPECGGLSLESFLILPVQRVTRYVILLRDLSKKTPENHVDYHNINAAQTYMDNICIQVNENKRSAENLKKQMDILTSLQGKLKPKDMVRDLVDQNRVFVKQAIITLYDQDSEKRRETCLFVFNDMLLVTKGDIKKDRFTITAKFTREDNLRLEVMADTDDFMGQQIKNAFVLHSPRVSYLFFCATSDERNLLCEHIRAAFR